MPPIQSTTTMPSSSIRGGAPYDGAMAPRQRTDQPVVVLRWLQIAAVVGGAFWCVAEMRTNSRHVADSVTELRSAVKDLNAAMQSAMLEMTRMDGRLDALEVKKQ